VKIVTKRGEWCGSYDSAPMTISDFVMRNIGSIPAENVSISVDKIKGNLNNISVIQANTSPGRIPNSGQCESMQFKGNDSIVLFIGYNALPGDKFTVWLIENYTQTRFSFKIFIT